MKTLKPLRRTIFSIPGNISQAAKSLLLFIIGKSFFAGRRFAKCISVFMLIILSSTQLFSQDIPDNYLDTTKWESIDVPKVKLAGRPKLVAKPAQTLAATTNPDIPKALLCKDLHVVFVLDESGSINGPESQTVRDGAKALANALLGSGATLQLVEFSSLSSIVDLGGTTVDATFISHLNDYLGINNGADAGDYVGGGYLGQAYNPGSGSGNCSGWTNWEDALKDIAAIDASQADLVMFFTDGNPTAYNVTSGGTNCSGQRIMTNQSDATALPPAIVQADLVKGQGKHMFLVGVGDDLNLSNIQAISGTDEFGQPDGLGGTFDILNADYTLPPFNALAVNLTKAVNAICGTVLTVDKTPSSAGVCAGQSVIFTHTLTNTGGDFNFTAQSVVVKDVYPDGYSNLQLLVPIPAGATITGGNTVNIPVGDMTAGQTLTYQVQATVDAPPGDYNSTITATAFNADQVTDNAEVASGLAKGELNIKTCAAQVEVNGELLDAPGSYQRTLQSLLPPFCDSVLTINITKSTADAPVLSIEDKCGKSTITAKDSDGNLVTDGLTWSNGATGNPIDVTTTDAVTATVTVGECTSAASNAVTPAPKAVPGAPVLSVRDNCNGTSTITATEAVTGGGGGAGKLITSGLTWSNGATGNPITVSITDPVTATVTTDGCPSDPSNEVEPQPGSSPAAPSIGVTENCDGTTVLTADVPGDLKQGAITWNTGEHTASITVTAGGTYTITYVAGLCTSGEGSVTVGTPKKTSPPTTETAVACGSYLWHGVTYTSSNNTATWTGTNVSGCDSVVTLNLTINNKPTIGALVCPVNICRNQKGVVITVTPGVGATSYEWVLPSGVTGSSTTNSITVAISATFITGAVKVRAKNDCGYSDYVQCTITSPTAIPQAPCSITGPTSFCIAGTYSYSVAAVKNATSYAWSVTGTGISIATGQGTTSITVTITSAFKTGSISVKAVNCLGSCATTTINLCLTGAPAKPGTISGPVTGVCKKTGVGYSVSAVSGATSYIWTVPAGVTITSGAGTNSIKVTFASGFTGGTITVAAKNACGTSGVSSLVISALPAQPGAITGSTSCKKSQTVVYSIAAVADAASYTWTITGGAKFSGTPTGTSATVIFSSCTSTTASLCVKANNACGSSATSCKTISVASSRPLAEGSVTDLDEESVTNYKAYPNPNNGQFSLSFTTKKMEKVAISIVDVTGHVIYKSVNTYTEGVHLNNINISKFAKGAYFVRIKRNGKEEKNIRIFVQ